MFAKRRLISLNLVIADPKTGKAYSKKIEDASPLIGKKIGEEVSLGLFGMDGYKAKITGGSDKQGFPMKVDLKGSARRKIYITTDEKAGMRERVSKRGNEVSDEIQQINLIVTAAGSKSLENIFGKAEAAAEGKEDAAKPEQKNDEKNEKK